MNRWTRILTLCLSVVIIAGLGVMIWGHFSRTREPSYLGKPLSAWLVAFDYGRDQPGASPRDARRAVREAGTNAFPLLFQMLRATDSPLKLKLIGPIQKQHFIAIHFQTAEGLHLEAIDAFQYLGVRANVAIPELIKLYDENPTADVQWGVAGVLGQIGGAAKAAIPSLQRQMASTNYEIRLYASNALANINPAPKNQFIPQPDWYNLQYQTDVPARVKAVNSMARSYGLYDPHTIIDRQGVVSLLVDLLKQPGGDVYWARFLLEELDPDAAAGVLTNHPIDSHLSNTDSFSVATADAILMGIGDWSEPVEVINNSTFRSRLLVREWQAYPGDALKLPVASVYLELQDLTPFIKHVPTALYFDVQNGVRFELRDAQGNLVPTGPVTNHDSFPSPYWAILPRESSLQLRINLRIFPCDTPGKLDLCLGGQSWLLPAGDTNAYFLSSTLNPPADIPNPLEYDVWSATLQSPSVKIFLPKP